MPASIVDQPFSPWHALRTAPDNPARRQFRCCANFVGSMRDFNAGDNVSRMTLEHYPAMTQHYLDAIVRVRDQTLVTGGCA